MRAAAPRRPVPRAQLRDHARRRRRAVPPARHRHRAASCRRGGRRLRPRPVPHPGQLAGGSWPPETGTTSAATPARHGQRPRGSRRRALPPGCSPGCGTTPTTRGPASARHWRRGWPHTPGSGCIAESPFRTGQDPARRPRPQARGAVPAVRHPPGRRRLGRRRGVAPGPHSGPQLRQRPDPATARSYASEFDGLPPDPRDADDERALNRALADARGQHPNQVFADVAPGIAARIMQLADGPGKAAELGREHGRSGTPPYCDISTEGEAAALMGALGETEPMTDANRQYRALLVTEYAGAYRDAAARRPPAGRLSRPHRGPRPPPRRPAARARPPRPIPPAAAGRRPRCAPRPPPGRLMTSRRNQPDASKETALMMTIQWTPEAIRALGATTDLPTLGEIFGLSTWRSREMAKTGEWGQAASASSRWAAGTASPSRPSWTSWASRATTELPQTAKTPETTPATARTTPRPSRPRRTGTPTAPPRARPPRKRPSPLTSACGKRTTPARDHTPASPGRRPAP